MVNVDGCSNQGGVRWEVALRHDARGVAQSVREYMYNGVNQ